MPCFSEQVAQEVLGLKFGSSALMASGMQPELAAHILLQNQALGSHLILRVGSTPVFNQRRFAKSGRNLTKTSNQGLFRGSLSVDPRFSRLTAEGELLGLDAEDSAHLQLSCQALSYQNRLPLIVTMQDVLREVDNDGFLEPLGYDSDKAYLRLAYRKGLGPIDFKGQFLINLKDVSAGVVAYYSRPWDKPESKPDWDPIHKVRLKPQTLNMIPDLIYRACFDKLLMVLMTDEQIDKPSIEQIKPALVFASKPETSKALVKAIKKSMPNIDASRMLDISHAKTRAEILIQLTDDEIRFVYQSCGLIITSDWDGLALTYPFDALAQSYTTTINTKVDDEDERIRNLYLLEAYARDYFKTLKLSGDSHGYIDTMIKSIAEMHDFFDEDFLEQAGSITAFECAYIQLLNRSYREKLEAFAREDKFVDCLQKGCDQGMRYFMTQIEQRFKEQSSCQAMPSAHLPIDDYKKISSYRALAGEAAWQEIKDEAVNHAYVVSRVEMMLVIADTRKLHITSKALLHELDEHLTKEMNQAFDNHASSHQVTHPDYDKNIQNLFQHGFAMRKPNNLCLSGAWLMLTNAGEMIYGHSEIQLIETLLVGDFLKRQRIDVNPNVSHPAWMRIVKKQQQFNRSDIETTQTLTYQTPDSSHASSSRNSFSISLPKRLSDAQKINLFGLLKIKKDASTVSVAPACQP